MADSEAAPAVFKKPARKQANMRKRKVEVDADADTGADETGEASGGTRCTDTACASPNA